MLGTSKKMIEKVLQEKFHPKLALGFKSGLLSIKCYCDIEILNYRMSDFSTDRILFREWCKDSF